MINQFEFFLSQPKLQAITLSLCLACLFFAVPFLQHKAKLKLTNPQKERYDPIAKDILFQVLILFFGVVVYLLVAFVRSDTSFVSGDALPFVSVLGSLSAFWNIRRAKVTIQNAKLDSNEQRIVRLTNVYGKSLNAYTAGLISLLYGLIVVSLVLFVPQELPKWSWFVNFLMTGLTIYSLSWSISSLAVATEYARNPKLGRSNKSFQRTGRASH